MAELRGAMGAVFKGAAGIYSKNLVFANGDEILNSDNLFLTKGFADGQEIWVYGTTLNDGKYDVETATAGTLVTSQAVEDETPASGVLIYTCAPGTQMTGFHTWSLENSVDLLEATDFADAGERSYIAGDAGWTASAQGHWMTDEDVEQYIGAELLVRFFTKYAASPSAGSPVYLYEGLSIVSGISVDTKIGALVDRPLTFKGIGPLVYRALTIYP